MEEKRVKVTNRSDSTVIYEVPELHVRRQFAPRAVQVVPLEEIVQVSYQQGGPALLYHYLLIEDEDVIHNTLNIKEEPEYWLQESQIPNWLKSSTIAEFTDALNFAPEGIKDLIKKYAVELPLTDIEKLDKIKDILGYNALSAIENKKAEEQDIVNGNSTQMPQAQTPPAKRQSTPTYKIVKTNK